MGTEHVKTYAEMVKKNAKFKTFSNKVVRSINRSIASSDEHYVKLVLSKYTFDGVLLASIHQESEGYNTIKVMTNDAVKNYAAEIEEGLKSPVVRKTAGNPKLARWIKERTGGYVPYSVLVGNSAGGKPHPQGLHFMRTGYQNSIIKSSSIINTELNKISSYGG